MVEALRRPWWWLRTRTPEAAEVTTEVRHGGDGDYGPVMIGVVRGPIAIEMARAALADAGIPIHIKQQSVGRIYGLSIGPPADAEGWVPPPLAAHAGGTLAGPGLVAVPGDEGGDPSAEDV